MYKYKTLESNLTSSIKVEVEAIPPYQQFHRWWTLAYGTGSPNQGWCDAAMYKSNSPSVREWINKLACSCDGIWYSR